MNVPNTLTLLRVFLTIAFIFFLKREDLFSTIMALALFVIASLTDYYDGYYAKRHNLISNFGKIMDPIADKFLMLSAFYIFMSMNIIAPWMFYVILIREVLITLMRFCAIKNGQVLAAEQAGKYKTVFQISTVIIILVYLILYQWDIKVQADMANIDMILQKRYIIINFLMWITIMLTLISGVMALWNNRRIFIKK